ncbi:MAG: hypothetical protein JRF25_09215, partial [Deltaproteobacteria bacterium]|nr:hypothetical protein [Deltaproteobacteria bacterium]
MTTNLPLPFKTTADFEYLRRVIMREETDGPVPIIEMMADPSFMGRVTGQNSPIDQMPEISEMYWSGEISREEADIKYYQFVDLVMAF